MIYQNRYYILVFTNRYIELTAIHLLPNRKLTLSVYEYTDKNMSFPLFEKDVFLNQTQTIGITNQGKYIVKIEHKLTAECQDIEEVIKPDIYIFDFYPYFEQSFIDEVLENLCVCDNCDDNKLSDCSECSENIELKNSFNSFIFIMFYILMYYRIENKEAFFNYLRDCLNIYELTISDRFLRMFHRGKIKGIFELDNKTKYVLITILYIYVFLMELDRTKDKKEVLLKFDYPNFKNCITKNGLDFYKFEEIFLNYNVLGYYISSLYTCNGLQDCDILETINEPYYFNKRKSIEGFSVPVFENNSKIIIAIPKIWGDVLRIYDDGNIDIKQNFNIVEYKNYYVYISRDYYIQGNYNFKIEYYYDYQY